MNKANNPQQRDLQTLAESVLKTTDLMCDVFTRETQALEQFDNDGFLSLQAEKLERARAYQQSVEIALARRAEFAALSPALREDLERRYTSFRELSQRNLAALERMRKTTSHLGETIRGAVMSAIKSNHAYSYGESGKIAGQKKTISIGLSETA